MTLTFDSPLTDGIMDIITDADFDHTDRIYFKTKDGRRVEFVKRYNGDWEDIWNEESKTSISARCSNCGKISQRPVGRFCRWCGSDMRGNNNE